LSSLQKIREQVSGKKSTLQQALILNHEKLEEVWDAYIDILKQRQNHPAVTAFQMAKLEIPEPHLLVVVTGSKLHFKFFEAERVQLIRHLQEAFFNPAIRFQLRLEEVITENTEKNAQVNQKDLYEFLSAEHPLLKNLKERLRFDIGF
jgi:hypothetical protein